MIVAGNFKNTNIISNVQVSPTDRISACYHHFIHL